MSVASSDFFKTKVLGHPAGLFVLFFTEMWERFSFYGMRVLLVNFLTMAAIGYNPGWEWTAENAGALFGTYAGLLYLTPILGGYIADKITGYRVAVVIGSIIMTLGHASMALETEFSLYLGLALLVIGTGFFKPTMTSIVSEMYKDFPEKKDGAYTIFYMGVNAGAFFGMMLCGYLAERIGWSWGFGLAGVFMLLGTLQFWLATSLFGNIGAKPSKVHEVELPQNINEAAPKVADTDAPYKSNPFTVLDYILIAVTAVIGLAYLINDPMSKIGGIDLFPFKVGGLSGQYVVVLLGLGLFLFLALGRIFRYDRITRDRMIAFIIFAFFTVFFWMAFEQGASSLVIFARDNVQRELLGNNAIIFNIVNALLTVVPLGIVTYVLYLLWKGTFKRIPGSNIVLVCCFALVWLIVGWMLNRDFNTIAYEVTYPAYQTIASKANTLVVDKATGEFKTELLPKTDDRDLNLSAYEIVEKNTQVYQVEVAQKDGSTKYEYLPVEQDKPAPKEKHKIITKTTRAIQVPDMDWVSGQARSFKDGNGKETPQFIYYALKDSSSFNLVSNSTIVGEADYTFKQGEVIPMLSKKNDNSSFGYVDAEKMVWAKARGVELKRSNGIVMGKVTQVKENWIEVTTSWFSILNSFFIIAFASMFSRWWESKYNPSAANKYALGLIIMGIGFGLLAFGASGEAGVKVSMVWLILAYLFHTWGELCISPVGLSYVSKLVPGKMIALMFGMWYLAIAIGNKLAAVLGGEIENITEQYSLSVFFLIFTIVPMIAGLLVFALNPVLKKLMHGVR